MSLDAVNPATGELLKTYDEMTPGETAAAVEEAHAAWKSWRTVPFAERARPMKKAAAVLRERKEEFARLMALEMGKPLKQGISEAEKCALGCDYYAEHAEAHLAPEMVKTEASKSYVAFEPLGVVLAVMPWNFPFWQVFRFAAPALMAGNTGVLKHASNVPGCALAIEDVFVRAGFPKGVFRTLLVGSRQVKAVIEHPLVSAVTLTGSTPAGKAVAAQAGAVLKKTVLELGGSDPYIILEDADLDDAVNTCATSRLINSGQSCVNAKRFIVIEALAAAFTEKLVAAMKTKKMGDPLAEGTDIGPQARPDLRDELHAQVMDSVAKGATLLLGGEIPRRQGIVLSTDRARRCQAGHAGVSTKSCSGPSRRCLPRATKQTPYVSPTTASSGLGPRCSPGTPREASASRASSRPGAHSSTRSSRPIRGCRSAASRNRATGVSWGPTASKNL